MKVGWVSFGNEIGHLAEGKPGMGLGASLKKFTVAMYGEVTGERWRIKWSSLGGKYE